MFASLDLFLFFLFWELELAPMFLLIGIWGGAAARVRGVQVHPVHGRSASAFMLVGILALFFDRGR